MSDSIKPKYLKEINDFFNSIKETSKVLGMCSMVIVTAGFWHRSNIRLNLRKMRILNHFLIKKNYFQQPWLYRRKFKWISYEPKPIFDSFNLKMTLVEGHPGSGKSTFIKHQVDEASEIRPAIYISFKTVI